MRKLILSAFLLSAYPLVSMGAHDDGGEVGGESQWTYYIENGGATITASTATGAVTIPSELGGYAVKKVGSGGPIFGSPNTSVTSVVLPEGVTHIGINTFQLCSNLTNVTIPSSVVSIASNAFQDCSNLTSVSIPFYTTVVELPSNAGSTYPQIIPDYTILVGRDDFVNTLVSKLANTLANNDAFVTAVANKIKATGGNYGIATQSGLSSAITTAVEPLATKTELTSSLAQSRTDGINSVLSNPNLWTLYTTSQIQNMAVGDLVLNRQVGGGFVLNYDIEQSTDLQTWTPYQALSLPLTGLPTDKAFVRIKAKQ
jgi:hypothetical protein